MTAPLPLPDDPRGPFLILAALWLEDDDTDAVANALRLADFPPPEGYPKGCVVAFRAEVSQSASFQHDLKRFDLGELNDWPRAPLAKPGVP